MDQTNAQCFQTWEETWGYIVNTVTEGMAPIRIGEFGTENGYRGWYYGLNPTVPTDPSPQNTYTDLIYSSSGYVQYAQGAWFTYLTQYIQQRGGATGPSMERSLRALRATRPAPTSMASRGQTGRQ